MLFFLPLICPSCKQKIFFCRDKENKKIYAVTDKIQSFIEPHICVLIEGADYWQNTVFEKYLKINFTPDDNIFQFVQNDLALESLSDGVLAKKTFFNNLGLLLRYDSLAANEQCLYLLTESFFLCKIFVKSAKKWKLGRWLSIYDTRMIRKNQFRSTKIQYFEISLKKTLDELAKHLSSLELSSEDSELLERHEETICSAIQKVGRVIAVFPVEKKKLHYFRRIFFFVEENLGNLMESLILPQKIEIYFQQETTLLSWNIYNSTIDF